MSRPAKRTVEDIKRDERVYFFLLKLADIKISPDSPGIKELQKQEITKKWGYTGDDTGRKFVERLLECLKENVGKKHEEKDFPQLTLSRLVEILQGIEKSIENGCKAENKDAENKDDLLPKVLGKLDKIRAIRKYCELSREQKKTLKLPVNFQAYIEENFIDLSHDYTISSSQASACLPSQDKYIDIGIVQQNENQDSVLSTIKKEHLEKIVKEVIEDKFSKDWLDKNNGAVEKIQKRVRNEITLIGVQSGLEIARYHLPKILSESKELSQQFSEAYQKQWEEQLSDQCIKQLTSNIIDNKIISDQIPIAFRYLEVKKVGPLPFESNENDLINQELLKKDSDNIATGAAFDIFKKNNAYQVKIHFRLKLEGENIDFFEEVSGISSILSLVRKALNRGLLWDIPCLKSYFPVIQEVYTEDKLFGGESLASVWSKSRGRLIKIDDLKYLLEHPDDNDFDSYVEGSDIIQSDYLGFDLIESIAMSGLHARLKLIEQTGINPTDYVKELKRRIQEKENLIKGKKYLTSYPFSLLVMENHLEKEILNNYKEEKSKSKIAYEAQLFIIQGYLDEGLVNKAGKLLEELKKHENYFSHFLKASYYLCLAEYNFLLDYDDKKGRKQDLIDECNKYLQKAEEQLQERLLEFFRIGEMAQGNLSPLYYYWTKIYIMKGRLSLFFPDFLQGESVSQLFSPLLSFGKARVYYAPREGDSYLCAKASLYQSLCYLIQAYIGNEPQGFDKKACIKWAKKLIDHGLLNYQEASLECYRDYVDNLFNRPNKKEDEPSNQHKTQDLQVEKPPFFNWILEENNKNSTNSDTEKNNPTVKIFDVHYDLIKRDCVSETLTETQPHTRDLFGQHSSLYFFVLGMIELCDQYSEVEASEHIKKSYNCFVCSWAISQGCSKIDKNGYKMDRDYGELQINGNKIKDEFNVSKLRSLFFHCISEWMDLAKIFMVVCKSILAEKENDEHFKVVSDILDENQGEDVFSKIPQNFIDAGFVDGQEDYNRHLKSAFRKIKEYFGDYKRNFPKEHQKKPLLKRRDEIVKAIFIRLRGG